MEAKQEITRTNAGLALGCGVAGVFLGWFMYWLVLPGVVLGLAAVVLGVRARRRGALELGSVALTVGIVSMLAVPAFLTTADSAEEWGRDCALHPEHDSNC